MQPGVPQKWRCADCEQDKFVIYRRGVEILFLCSYCGVSQQMPAFEIDDLRFEGEEVPAQRPKSFISHVGNGMELHQKDDGTWIIKEVKDGREGKK